MATDMPAPSLEATQILRLLKRHHNVLVSGPPAIGKSRLLNEVSRWFEASAQIGHDPAAPIPLPQGLTVTPAEAADWLPSPARHDRQVFSTAFHPGSRYRDFLRGLVPKVGTTQGFVVSEGTLYRAATLGLTTDGAALLIVDEINRGPAIQVFGDTIVALEGDKRLDDQGDETTTTQWFEMMADDGTMERFALPHHLYILAAMNQADTSVEPLDVAFLRRFEPYRLEPDTIVLRQHFGLSDTADPLPGTATEPAHVYAATVRAWEQVNRRIGLGRGVEFRIGHGVFMGLPVPAPTGDQATDVAAASAFVAQPWRRVRAHIDEVFFGHTRGAAAVLNVGAPGHPLALKETYFAGDPMVSLEGNINDLYSFLLAVATNDAE